MVRNSPHPFATMQTIVDLTEVEGRLDRLGIPPKVLAERIGVNFSTLYRWLRGRTSIRLEDARRVTAALVALEIERRDYLLALHPLTTDSAAPAAA